MWMVGLEEVAETCRDANWQGLIGLLAVSDLFTVLEYKLYQTDQPKRLASLPA